MTNYTRLNNITGWIVFIIASATYLLTMEPTTSLWDCGEYITTANKLEVGHPPGAPLFMMLGRLFSAFASPENAAMMVNAMSALSSSFTILFLFWSITMLARKFSEKTDGTTLSKGSIIAILGSGVVGALAYTFTDSFWFSAVEGEVYAMSSLFTAAVFWAILKWERVAHEEHANRWLILIAYLIGLSIGVHLLNLLAIPAIAFVYYFKKKEYSHKGFIITGVLSIIILGAIQALVIPKSIQVAAWFERVFTNSFGMPFNSGTIVFGVLLISLLVFAIKFTMDKGKVIWNTIVVSFMVILIGYSSFAMIVIRSNANTPLDENNPETLTSLLAYLNREQYGSWPILSGPYFNSPTNGYNDKNPTYMKAFIVENGGKKHSFHTEFNAQKFISDNKLSTEIRHEYIVVKDGKNAEANYDSKYTTIFPRMFEKDPAKIKRYKIWSGYDGTLSSGNPSKPLPAIQIGVDGTDRLDQYNKLVALNDPQAQKAAEYLLDEGIFMPSMKENLQYFFDYQMGWMYWRYFMWNFSGRQNDVQGHGKGGASMLLEGNWLSGIDAIDSERLGNQSELPSSISNNPGYNKYFMIPLLIGLIGFFFQLIKAPKDWFVIMLLFLFTGFAIIIYLNQKPVEPRERDYAYAASFYAFSFWIGLGVLALFNIAKSITMKEILKVSGIGLGTGVAVLLIESAMGNGHAFSYSLIYLSGLGGLISLIMTFVGKSKNEVISAGLAVLFCLPAPILLAKENWNDHDRSNRYLARDMAVSYLESCEPNAILFSVGDNDTFPLWYVQEVEGIRTDVRVVNLSLLGADWHANQAKMKAYKSDPLPLSLPESAYRTGTRDAVLVGENKNQGVYFDAKTILNHIINNKDGFSDARMPQVKHRIPANKFFIPVNKENCLKYGIVDEKDKDRMLDSIKWTVTSGVWYRPDLIVFDLLANFNWERPIYFTSPDVGQNSELNKYLTADGLVHRLTPIVQNHNVDLDQTYNHIMNDFKWGNLNDDITMDYYSTRQIGWLRRISLVTAQELLAAGDSTRSIDILDKCMLELPLKNIAMDEVVQNMGLIYIESGAKEKGLALLKEGVKKSTENLNYLLSFDDKHKKMELYNISEYAEQLGVMLPRIIYRYDLDEDIMDEFGSNAVLDKFKTLAEKYLRDQSNPNAQPILSAVPRELLQQWFPELFQQK